MMAFECIADANRSMVSKYFGDLLRFIRTKTVSGNENPTYETIYFSEDKIGYLS